MVYDNEGGYPIFLVTNKIIHTFFSLSKTFLQIKLERISLCIETVYSTLFIVLNPSS